MSKLAQFRDWLKRWWRGFSREASKRHAKTQMLKMEQDFKRWQKTGVFLALLALILSGCAAVDPTYLAADRATYDAVAEDWVKLQPEGVRKTVARSVADSWLARITEAENANR